MKTYLDYYREYRTTFWKNPQHFGKTGIAKYQLASAKREADIRQRWEKAEDSGLVRLEIVPDEVCSLDDLLGDCFDPDVNSDIKSEILAKQKQWEIDRIERDGVWGVRGQFKCPSCHAWQDADSCWGFVGEDWRDSGYDLDIMDATLDAMDIAYSKHVMDSVRG
jgi:hypothetical protein